MLLEATNISNLYYQKRYLTRWLLLKSGATGLDSERGGTASAHPPCALP